MRKKRKSYFKTISGKLSVFLGALTLVALVALVSAILANANGLLVNRQMNELKYNTNTYAETFRTFMEEQKSFIEGVANSTIAYDEADNREQIRKVIRGYKNLAKDNVADMYIAFADKDLYMMSGSEEGLPSDFDARTRSWYTQAVEENQTIVSAPYTDEVSGNMMITVATPIYKGSTLIGVAGEDVYITELIELTESIDFADGVYGFLVDSAGNYVSHKNEAYLPSADGAIAVDEHELQALETKEAAIKTVDYTGESVYMSASIIRGCDWKLGIVLPAYNVSRQLVPLYVMAVIISLIVLILVLILIPVLTNKMLKPVGQMKEFIRENILKENASTALMTETREIDYLVTEMEKTFLHTVKATGVGAKIIQNNISEITESIGDTSDSIDKFNSSLDEIKASVDSNSDRVGNVNSSLEEITRAVESVANQATDTASRASEIVHTVEAFLDEVEVSKSDAANRTNTVKKSMQSAIAGVSAIKDMQKVSETINGIIEQISMLSLNAQIESARQGEAGKGFAVVADSMNNLAEETKNEIMKIDMLIKAIISSVEELSEQSNLVIEYMDEAIGTDIQKLENLAQAYKKDADYYGNSSSELGATSEELSASIQSVAEHMSDITSEMEMIRSNTDMVADEMVQLVTNVKEINGKSVKISHASGELVDTVEQLKL